MLFLDKTQEKHPGDLPPTYETFPSTPWSNSKKVG